MRTFKTSIPVNYYDLNLHQELSPVSLLNFLEETAIRHSKSVGVGVEKLLALGKGWLLTRWSVQMDRYPKWGETVNIETWPFRFERFYATREFSITDKDHQILGRATSLWIFFDLNRKRPVRIPPEIIEAYGTSEERMVHDPFSDLPQIKNAAYETPFRVRLSDIDTNDHVNNIKYVEWTLESLPPEVHRNFQLASLEVAYCKETNFGCTIRAEAAEAEAGIQTETETKAEIADSDKIFLHKITNRDKDHVAALARTIWKKR